MLVYNAEIWPEYKVAHTKSDWTGFKITSDITVTYSLAILASAGPKFASVGLH